MLFASKDRKKSLTGTQSALQKKEKKKKKKKKSERRRREEREKERKRERVKREKREEKEKEGRAWGEGTRNLTTLIFRGCLLTCKTPPSLFLYF